ncbi:hypothetical protein QE152_g38854 [Popillia japonica]|uniref:Uncharacterized protein n=1 Tax=Popillia japonica TaxID=7064 RepID=A0AAW1HVM0_POPJA
MRCASKNGIGPVTVPMVSTNSSPPVAMPVQVPPGHVVQQIVDESGTLRHVIISPQHPPGVLAITSHNPQHYIPKKGLADSYLVSEVIMLSRLFDLFVD